MTLNCNITNQQENEATMQLLPNGSAWYSSLYSDSNLYNFFLSISSAIVDFKRDACLLIDEFFCTRHSALSAEWLEEYGLPDRCDPTGETLCLLANGLDASLGFSQILEDALERLGITATVINEAPNGVPLTVSIVLSPASDLFAGCYYYAGGTSLSTSLTVCGVALDTLGCNAADPDDPSNSSGMVAVDPDTYVSAVSECGFIAGDASISCDNALSGGVPLTGLIPDLSCVLEDVVPLGIRLNYYLGNKDTPVLGG